MPNLKLDLSVVIITLNEEPSIESCIRSLPDNCEIIVLDSGSSDRTVQIATQLGARTETRTFDDFSQQKNAAIRLASRKWVLSIDADEILDKTLAHSVSAIVGTDESKVDADVSNPIAYSLNRKLIFMGRQMRFGKTCDHPIRLFQKNSAWFQSAIHEKLDVKGEVISLPGTLLHNSFANLEDYFFAFNKYTTKTAENKFAQGKSPPVLALHIIRPMFEFLSRYIVRLGFLDGYRGYLFACLSSFYAYIKYEKLRELYRTNQKSSV